MEQGKEYRVRPGRGCPSRERKRIGKLGHTCKVLRHVEESGHYPGLGPCVELEAGDGGYQGWAGDAGRWRAWFPVKWLSYTPLVYAPDDDDAPAAPTLAAVQQADVYGQIDEETATHLRESAENMRSLVRQAATAVVEIGCRLIDAKERLGHGLFEQWCDGEFGWTPRTCRRYMQVAQAFAESDNIDRFDTSALYLLASSKASDEVRTEAFRLASQGQTMTHSRVADLLEQYAPEVAPDPMRDVHRITRTLSTTTRRLEELGAPDNLIRRAQRLSRDIERHLGEVVDVGEAGAAH